MNWRDIPIPIMVARLPRDARGYPVPAFVYRPPEWKSGDVLDLRVLDTSAALRSARERTCGVCGGSLFARMWFIGGPMCLVNNIFETPVHRECAEFALKVCPHLSRSGAEYSTRAYGPDTSTDPNLVRQRPPYQVLVSSKGYQILTHDPQTRARLPKPLLRLDGWQRVEFMNDDGTPTADRYAVISSVLGTALYCFACIGHGKRAISFNPADIEQHYCGSCKRFLDDVRV